ncbi:PREDICTED: WW domain-containing oxidoreductase-like [Priapulus caudatus]|uniref:WW domain-containing oxidoreductase n=1 Tax=Priapulus caudatus TaxID=37621 RepID=A0ABM1EI56_PRICU|nr:PREDICTED: WW domain-containing oxidoreductase-like [Priapulus caudatus]
MPKQLDKQSVPDPKQSTSNRRRINNSTKCQTNPLKLPYGWERKVTESNHIYYVDHINKKTTYSDPRLAFAVEDNSSDAAANIRQRFDGSSRALEVLHGRDLSDKYVIVTGGNTGIGYETARSLALHGAHVVLASRSKERGEAAAAAIHTERPEANVKVMMMDLTSLASVREFANNYRSKKWPLHIFILNAAVFALPYSKTEDGFETIFQVNYLSQYYLTNLLEDVLIRSAPTRIVVLSSESHRFSDLCHNNMTEDRLSPPSDAQFSSMSAYNQSKLCCSLFSNALNWRLSSQGVACNSLHPGNMVSSSLSRNWWFYRLLFATVRPFTKSLQQAAATSVYCATATELEGVGGLYFNNCCVCQPSDAALDAQNITELWDLSEMMVKKAVRSMDPDCSLIG